MHSRQQDGAVVWAQEPVEGDGAAERRTDRQAPTLVDLGRLVAGLLGVDDVPPVHSQPAQVENRHPGGRVEQGRFGVATRSGATSAVARTRMAACLKLISPRRSMVAVLGK